MGSVDQETECQESSSLNLLFSDHAEESVLSYVSIPTSGSFRPAGSLTSTFGGLPIDGEWKLSIALMQSTHQEKDHHHTSYLLDWELKMDARTCTPHAKWEKLEPIAPSGSALSPRRLHTAVGVGNSIFVAGGLGESRRTDLWRFDYDSNKWTELNSATARVGGKTWPLNGQAAFLGQSGLLTYGGIAKHGPLGQGRDLWLLDLFSDNWVAVPIQQNALHGGGEGHHFKYVS